MSDEKQSDEQSIPTTFAEAVAAGRAYAEANVQPVPPEYTPNWWQTYGPHLNRAIDIVYDGSKAAFEAHVAEPFGLKWHQVNMGSFKTAVQDAMKAWDNEFKWDAPNMSDATEDKFYEWLVSARIDLLVEGVDRGY